MPNTAEMAEISKSKWRLGGQTVTAADFGLYERRSSTAITFGKKKEIFSSAM